MKTQFEIRKAIVDQLVQEGKWKISKDGDIIDSECLSVEPEIESIVKAVEKLFLNK